MNGVEITAVLGSGIFFIIVLIWLVLWFCVPFVIFVISSDIKAMRKQNEKIINLLNPKSPPPVVSGNLSYEPDKINTEDCHYCDWSRKKNHEKCEECGKLLS